MQKKPLEIGSFYEAPGEYHYADPLNWYETRHKFVPGEKIQLIGFRRIYHTVYAICQWNGYTFELDSKRLLDEERMKLRAASLAKKEK